MTREDLGKYFIRDGEIYQAISYTDHPTIELKNIVTGNKESIVVDSIRASEYCKLYKVQVNIDNGIYDLDTAILVYDIQLNMKKRK